MQYRYYRYRRPVSVKRLYEIRSKSGPALMKSAASKGKPLSAAREARLGWVLGMSLILSLRRGS